MPPDPPHLTLKPAAPGEGDKSDPTAVTGNEVFRWLGAYYIHQDQLGWSRIQALVAIEVAVLAGGYTVQGPLSLVLLTVGTITIITFLRIIWKDWSDKFWAEKLLKPVFIGYGFNVEIRPSRFWPPFGARTIITTLVVLFAASNVGLAVAKVFTIPKPENRAALQAPEFWLPKPPCPCPPAPEFRITPADSVSKS